MKLIAITQRLERKETGEIREALDVQWAVLFQALGVVPVVLPTLSNTSQVFKSLPIQGVIFSGGNDIGRVSDDPLSRQRDQFEGSVLKLALKKKIPVLGICRGMQFLADMYGAPCERVEGHVATRHAINVSEKSIYKADLAKMKDVNSFHNYGVRQAPKGFLASAIAPDGVVEAIEQPAKKIFAQMWHPERETPFVPSQMQLLKAIFKIR